MWLEARLIDGARLAVGRSVPFALSSTHTNTRRLFVRFLFSTDVIDSHVCAAVLLLLLLYSLLGSWLLILPYYTSSLALTLRKAQPKNAVVHTVAIKHPRPAAAQRAQRKSKRWTEHRTTLYERRTIVMTK